MRQIVNLPKKRAGINLQNAYVTGIYICIILFAVIPAVNAYDQCTASRIAAAGYNPDEFTLEVIGYDAVQNGDIYAASWSVLDKFYTKYHDILPSRWGGEEVTSPDLIPGVYIFRVLPDGSTMSYFDFYNKNENLSAPLERANEWRQIRLEETTKRLIAGNCADTILDASQQIGFSDLNVSFVPYGRLGLESSYSWENDDQSNLEEMFIKNYLRIEPGDYLHIRGEEKFDANWYADQLIFKQYLDRTTGSYKLLPSSTLVTYQRQAEQARPYSITFTIKDDGGVGISFPLSIFDGDKVSAGSSGNSWVNWEEHFRSFPFNSDGAKNGAILSSGMHLTCKKDAARDGTTYVLTKNVIYPNRAFKNGLWNFKPENVNNLETYMTARWYTGGWKPSISPSG